MPAPKTPTPEQTVEEFTTRAKAFNEDVLESSKKAGEAYLSTLERGLKSYADLHEEVGKALPFDWTTPVATAQASTYHPLSAPTIAAIPTLRTAMARADTNAITPAANTTADETTAGHQVAGPDVSLKVPLRAKAPSTPQRTPPSKAAT